jgi:putative ABC transport system permease protein
MTRSEFRENLIVSLDTLRAHKVRSALTLLGVVIGVTSVITVAAIIDGLNKYVADKVEKMGSRSYFVTRFPFGTDPNRMPEKYRLRRYLQYSDADKIKDTVHSIDKISALGTRANFFGDKNELRYGGERVERAIIRGASADYCDVIPMFVVEQGRYYTQAEVDRAAPVVVLGQAIADSLFGRATPLGKQIMMNGSPYEVIGVFAHDEGLLGGPGVDQFAMIPLSTFRKHYPESKEVIIIYTVRRDVDPAVAQDEVGDALRRIRKVSYKSDNDFEILSSDFLSKLWGQLTGAIVILTSVISSIGLLVGGIGVMNIMLISVTERTKEIGIRKAIGARASDIRVQFLLEALMLTVAGGMIGILGGFVLALLIRTAAPSIGATVSPFWATMGVTLSAMVGLFFGYWPANRAAKLDPIVCLRYE